MAYNANNPTRNGTVMLCDYHSYTTWFQQLIATCEFNEVWSIVNPDSPIERMPMPVKPVLPEIEDYSPIPTVDTPTVRQELSASGQKAYKEHLDQQKNLFNIYKTRLSRYEREANNLKAVAVWIQTNVLHNLQKTCCKPHLTLKVWIDTLRSTVGVEDELEEERAVRAYLNALKPMRLPTQWETWLIDYEFAATEAEAQGVGETIKKKRMFRDFMDSVVKVAPSWVSSFQATGLKNPTRWFKSSAKQWRDSTLSNQTNARPLWLTTIHSMAPLRQMLYAWKKGKTPPRRTKRHLLWAGATPPIATGADPVVNNNVQRVRTLSSSGHQNMS
jgi:hypothetical protein